jgi:CheY-like chemotaxis protein
MANVLIVDDDAGVRETVRATLEEAGHQALEAGDGDEALTMLRASPTPLVALVDLRMPTLDGFALLQAVDEDWALADRHAYVVFSADTESLPVVRALRSTTVVTGVAKPYEIDVLLDAVDQAAAVLAAHSANTIPPHLEDERGDGEHFDGARR